jgi:hypothetical protein
MAARKPASKSASAARPPKGGAERTSGRLARKASNLSDDANSKSTVSVCDCVCTALINLYDQSALSSAALGSILEAFEPLGLPWHSAQAQRRSKDGSSLRDVIAPFAKQVRERSKRSAEAVERLLAVYEVPAALPDHPASGRSRKRRSARAATERGDEDTVDQLSAFASHTSARARAGVATQKTERKKSGGLAPFLRALPPRRAQ